MKSCLLLLCIFATVFADPQDEVCFLPSFAGHVEDIRAIRTPFHIGFTYDMPKNFCNMFFYTLNGSNSNNFISSEECKKACVRPPCSLPPFAGEVKVSEELQFESILLGYTYWKDMNACRFFPYIKSGSNANKFTTLDECEKLCLKSY